MGSARYIGAMVVLALLGAPVRARAASAEHVAELLSAERAANGIPSAVATDPKLSAACAAHDRYMAGGPGLTHAEIRGTKGYSVSGAYAAANAVLAQGEGWDHGDPYERAPLHLDQLLAPRLAIIGSADFDGFSCTTTFPGWTRPAPSVPKVYTFPGPGAAIAPSEVTSELPLTPTGLVGLRRGASTGPVLLVFIDAPGQRAEDNPARLTDATLSGPAGPVAVRSADGTTPVPGGGRLAPYIAPGGFLVPVRPLLAQAVYHAAVRVSFAGITIRHQWSFVTRGGDPRSTLREQGSLLAFTSASPAPIRITFARAGGGTAPAVTIRPGHSLRLHLAPGSWQLCGAQSSVTSYASYQGCLSLTVTGHPVLGIGSPSVHGHRLVFPLRLSGVLLGRPATLTTIPLVISCVGGRCSSLAGRAVSHGVTLRRSLALALPSSGHAVMIELRSDAFTIRDASYAAADASFTWKHG